MLNVALRWYVYLVMQDPMSLAGIGLVQSAPTIGLVLVGGHFADRFNLRRIIALALLVQSL